MESRIDAGEYEVAAEQARGFRAARSPEADPVEVVALTRLQSLALALGGDVETGIGVLASEFSGERALNESLLLIRGLKEREEFGRAVEAVEIAMVQWPDYEAQFDDWHGTLAEQAQLQADREAFWARVRPGWGCSGDGEGGFDCEPFFKIDGAYVTFEELVEMAP